MISKRRGNILAAAFYATGVVVFVVSVLAFILGIV